MRKEYAQKGPSPPDEETARRRYVGQNVTAPNLVTVEDFIRFYIATTQPQLDKEKKRPTADSINIAAEWFFAGYTRVTETDKEEQSEELRTLRRVQMRNPESRVITMDYVPTAHPFVTIVTGCSYGQAQPAVMTR